MWSSPIALDARSPSRPPKSLCLPAKLGGAPASKWSRHSATSLHVSGRDAGGPRRDRAVSRAARARLGACFALARRRVHRSDGPDEGQFPMSIRCLGAGRAFWRRVGAMLLKEFLQLRRDRITFGHHDLDPAPATRAVRLSRSTQRRGICRPRCCSRGSATSGVPSSPLCRTPSSSRSRAVVHSMRPRSTSCWLRAHPVRGGDSRRF